MIGRARDVHRLRQSHHDERREIDAVLRCIGRIECGGMRRDPRHRFVAALSVEHETERRGQHCGCPAAVQFDQSPGQHFDAPGRRRFELDGRETRPGAHHRALDLDAVRRSQPGFGAE